MDASSALDRLRADLGPDLRVFVDVRDDTIRVPYVRPDIDHALEGATRGEPNHAHLRDIAAAMLPPGGTASVRYTPDAIIVGLPRPGDDSAGYLLSLEHEATDDVDEFIETLLGQGATIMQSTVSGPATFTGDGSSPQLND